MKCFLIQSTSENLHRVARVDSSRNFGDDRVSKEQAATRDTNKDTGSDLTAYLGQSQFGAVGG
jgi:hypothetical protein